MDRMIKTNRSWQRHLPQRPKKAKRNYYSHEKTNYQKIIIRIIYIIVFLLIFQSIFQLAYLKIDKVKLDGQKDLSADEVQEFVINSLRDTKFLFFEKNNYFLVPLDDLSLQLQKKYNLDSVEITKKWPDILQITVKEKSSHFIWSKDDSLYLLDAKGRLNRQISVLDDKYLLLDDKRSLRPQGEQIFSAEEIDIINSIDLIWSDLITDKTKLQKITIYDHWNLDLNTQMGFYVKIDKDQDIYEQLNNLRAVLEENITGVDIDYIDVRFGDKVYFK